MEYPIKKFDSLNRMVYVDWNGVERCANVYWSNTKNVKIKYRYWHQDIEVEAYDKNGIVIMKSSSGILSLKLPRLIIESGKITYCVDKKKIIEWSQKLALKQY